MAILYTFRTFCWRFLPHILLILVQIFFSIQYFLAETAFKDGLSPHVYVTYRYFVGGLVVFPFAYVLERYITQVYTHQRYVSYVALTLFPLAAACSLQQTKKARPKLTFPLFLEIFVLSIVGASLTVNLYFASLKYTSPTFVTTIINTVPAMTFLMAVILRLEIVNVRKPRGIAKIIGTFISLAGVLIITLYEGPKLHSLHGAPIHIRRSPAQENWIKGSVLLVASSISWSTWFIMQAYTLKKYPAQLSLTVWINIIAGAQSAVFTAIIQHKPEAWRITFNIKFWSIIYAGVINCGLTIFVQLWCTKQKGPVFVTIFGPLSTLITAVLAYFLFGEELYTGSILGGFVIIIGLYLLLWGKERDQYRNNYQQQSSLTGEGQKAPQIQMETSAEREAKGTDE